MKEKKMSDMIMHELNKFPAPSPRSTCFLSTYNYETFNQIGGLPKAPKGFKWPKI